MPARPLSFAAPTISSTVDGVRTYPLCGTAGAATLNVPAMMSRKDFELYKKQVENSLCIIEATAVTKDESGN